MSREVPGERMLLNPFKQDTNMKPIRFSLATLALLSAGFPAEGHAEGQYAGVETLFDRNAYGDDGRPALALVYGRRQGVTGLWNGIPDWEISLTALEGSSATPGFGLEREYARHAFRHGLGWQLPGSRVPLRFRLGYAIAFEHVALGDQRHGQLSASVFGGAGLEWRDGWRAEFLADTDLYLSLLFTVEL